MFIKEIEEKNVIPIWAFQSKMKASPLKELREYWSELRAGRMVPLRSEIDPREIAGTLEFSFIVERIEPGVVRFRLAGAHLNDMMGMEVRGMPLTAILSPESRNDFKDHLESLFMKPETQQHRLKSADPSRPLDATLLLLPLKNDMGEVDRAIGCLISEGQAGIKPHRFKLVESEVTDLRTGRMTRQRQEVQAAAPAPVPTPTPAAAGTPEAGAAYSNETRDAVQPSSGRAHLRLVKNT